MSLTAAERRCISIQVGPDESVTKAMQLANALGLHEITYKTARPNETFGSQAKYWITYSPMTVYL